MNKSVEVIVHRSKNCIIVDDIDQYNRKRRRDAEEHKHQGQQAPSDKPYVPLGKLSNILFVLDAVKKTIPHSKRIRQGTEKSIKLMKKNKHPTLFGK